MQIIHKHIESLFGICILFEYLCEQDGIKAVTETGSKSRHHTGSQGQSYKENSNPVDHSASQIYIVEME